MKRGRPTKSIVRNRLVEMLYVLGRETAYNLHKFYLDIFGKISQRNVYYQLQKGVDLDLFQVEEKLDEKGNFSWGEVARKTYYKLGKAASPQIDKNVVEYFKHFKQKKV